jgi:hypothetical protein
MVLVTALLTIGGAQGHAMKAPEPAKLAGAQQALPGGGRGRFHNALIFQHD